MKQVGAGPVKDGHKVVANHFHAELGQITDGLAVVFDVLIPGRQADLDVIVDVHGLHHIHVEAVGGKLLLDLGNFLHFPDFPGQFVVQSPDDAGDTGDLLDVGELDVVIALAVPAETHLHWHWNSSLFFFRLMIVYLYFFTMEIAKIV